MSFKKLIACLLVALIFLQLQPLNIISMEDNSIGLAASADKGKPAGEAAASPAKAVEKSLKAAADMPVITENTPEPTKIPSNTPSEIFVPTPVINITDTQANTTPGATAAFPETVPAREVITPAHVLSQESRITLNLDKTAAQVGDIITAALEVNDIADIAAYQVNLKYDPSVLQPVDPLTLNPFDSTTKPLPGSLMSDKNHSISFLASNDITKGILNFGAYYTDYEAYKRDSQHESTGSLALISFKVLEPNVTTVAFENTGTMPGSINGTYIYDCDGIRLSGYSVDQAAVINTGGPAALPEAEAVLPERDTDNVPEAAGTTAALGQSGEAYKITGYVKPELDSSYPDIKAGFLVEVEGMQLSALTDARGRFEIANVPGNPAGYTLKISKPNYLYREINNIAVNSYILLGTPDAPVPMWAGDVLIDGIQDNAINMTDIMKIRQYFGSIAGDGEYDPNYDLNCDNAISMADVIIATAHYNTLPASYPAVPPEQDTVSPGMPASIDVIGKTNTSVTFSWSASTDNINVAGYNIYNNGSLAACMDGQITSCTVDNLDYCSTNIFTVEAYDDVYNKSAQSDPLSVTLDMVLDNDLTISKSLTVSGGTVNLNTYDLTVTGDVYQSGGTIDIYCGQMTVSGSIIQSSGTMFIDAGTLNVKGDYKLDMPGANGQPGSGVLKMTGGRDAVNVNGSFRMLSSADHSGYLTAGILEVKGDFEQRSGTEGSPSNFAAGSSHKVILDGDNIQNVYFEDIGISRFNVLEINKPLDCYVFGTPPAGLRAASSEPVALTARAAGEDPPAAWDKLIEEQKTLCKFGGAGVDPATGNYSNTFTDMLVKSPGFDIVFSRTYNSKDDRDAGLFGRGWRFSYEAQIEELAYGQVRYKKVTMPDGSVLYYRENSDGTFTADGTRNTLQNTGAAYILKTPDQFSYIFNTAGKLVEMSDRNNNAVQLLYGSSGALQTIQDVTGRTCSIGYYPAGDSHAGRIRTITAPGSRTVTYNYDGNNLLESVLDPANNLYVHYEYDENKYLTAIRNGNMNSVESIEYNHNDKDRVARYGNSSGKDTSYWYDDINRSTGEYENDFKNTTVNVQDVSAGSNSALYDIKYNGEVFVATDMYGKIFYSDDGYSWASTNVSGVISVAWGNNSFVAVGSNTILASTDGRAWQRVNTGVSCYINEVIWTGTNFVAVAEVNNVVLISSDGISWRHYEAPDNFQSIAWNGSVYVAISYDRIFTSKDCILWEKVYEGHVPEGYYEINRVVWGNNIFVAYGFGSYFYATSTDGYNWTNLTFNFLIHNSKIIWCDGMFYSIEKSFFSSNYNEIDVSTDGVSWRTIDADLGDNFYYSLCKADDKIVAVGDNGKIATVKFNGGTNTYKYDGSYHITEITDPERKTTSMTYTLDSLGRDLYGEEASVTDRNNATSSYVRDSNGNIVRITNPDNSVKEMGYNNKNNLIFETDEVGNCTIYVYDAGHINLIKKAQSLTKLGAGGIAAIKQQASSGDLSGYLAGNASGYAVTVYNYINGSVVNGLLDTVTDPEGKKTGYTYYTDGYLKEEAQYDESGSMSSKRMVYTYNDKGLAEYVTTPEGHRIKYEYDMNGQPVRVRQYDMNGVTQRGVRRIAYDMYGRKIKEVSPKFYNASLDSSDNVYDAANSNTDYYKYDYYVSGKVKSATDPMGNATSYTYNAFGSVLSETRPNGSVYTYEYDSMNRLTKTYFKPDSNSSPVLISENVYGYIPYNGSGTSYDMEQVTKTDYIESGRTLTTKTTYDYAGRIVEQQVNGNQPVVTQYYPNGTVKSVTDSKGSTTNYYYDRLNLLTKLEVPYGNVNGSAVYSTTLLDYYKNGSKQSDRVSINKPGQTAEYSLTEYKYNSRNLLSEVIQYDYSSGTEKKNYTEYYYDWDGNRLRMYTGLNRELLINGLDNVTSTGDNSYSTTKYEYGNYLGKLTKMTDPLGEYEEYTGYDPDGNLTTMRDRNRNTITLDYDKIGRMISKSIACSDPGKNVSYSCTYYYDTDSKASMSSGGINTTYSYDRMGRLTGEAQSDGVTKEYTYYGNSGSRETMKITVGGVEKENERYDYDGYLRLYNISENGQPIATYTYDANGNRETLVYANGNSTAYSYNPANKLVTLTNKKGPDTVSQYGYTYYLDGSQASETERISGKSGEYSYDDLRRLTNKTDETNGIITGTASYTYDDYSNRSSIAVTGPASYNVSYVYDAANRLVSETKTAGGTDETTTYGYDDNGSQLSKTVNGQTTNYSYNGFNQLTGVGAAITYTYNGDGLRTGKTVNGATTAYVWDGGQIALELDGSGNVTNKYMRGLNLIYAEDGTGNNRKYYLYNGHGDVVKLADTVGNTVKSYDYDAFGNEKNPDVNDTNAFRYSGEYFDKETGTIYLRARYYNPADGRFTTEDSVRGSAGTPLSLNLYTYCWNNPINAWDPSGYAPIRVNGHDYYPWEQENITTDTYLDNPYIPGDVKSSIQHVKETGNSSSSGVTVGDVAKSTVINTVGGVADTVLGSAIAKLPNTTKSTTSIPSLGVAMEAETLTVNAGTKALKGVSKIAGPVAVASYGYDVYQDVNKYQGADAVKAVAVTTLGTGLTIAAGVACTGVGAPVGAAIAVGVGVGVGVGIIGDKVKEWWIGY